MSEIKIKKDLIAMREEWRKLPNYMCFWSSPDNPQGLKLTPTIELGRLYVTMVIEKHHSGYPGIAHGGIAFAILDGLMSWYAMSHYGRAAFTLEATIKYQKPLVVGKSYLFEVKEIGGKKDEDKSLTLQGDVYENDLQGNKGASLQTMIGKFILPTKKMAEKILGLSIEDDSFQLFPEK